jgi:hypothetical protein
MATTAQGPQDALNGRDRVERSGSLYGELAELVDGAFSIARAIESLADAVYKLGVGNASTPYGAVEALAMSLNEGFDGIASAIRDLRTQI